MITEHNIITYEEVKQRATFFFISQNSKAEKLSIATHLTENDPYSYIKDKESGAMVCIFKNNLARYTIRLLSAEESKKENWTFPYRDITEEHLPIFLSLGIMMIKPVMTIPIYETKTIKATNAINLFCGDSGYDSEQPEMFIRYALYEFFRTENYNHLSEILSEQPSECNNNLDILGGGTAQDYIINRYICERGLRLLEIINSAKKLKEIAEYTGTPYDMIIRASRLNKDL